jgi:shikimate kinase
LNHRRICLTGFMGSGKTSVGFVLADKLGLPFYDLDVMITSTTGTDIATIFAEKGEPYFRQIERANLIEMLSKDIFVLALGGGTQFFNEQILHKSCTLVWLKTDLQSAIQRVQKQNIDRPLWQNNAKALEELFVKRESVYQKADIIVNSDDAIERVADAIIDRL